LAGLGPRPSVRGVADPHKYAAPYAEFGRSRSSGVSVIKEIRLKHSTPASRLSMSLKVIGTDTDRSAACDFLLTFHDAQEPILYRFRDKQRVRRKSQIPLLLNAHAEEVPLGIGYRGKGQKLE